MTPAALEQLARDAARQALGRDPTWQEIARTLAIWLAEADQAVSAGYLRRPPLGPVRPPKKPAPMVDGPPGGGDA